MAVSVKLGKTLYTEVQRLFNRHFGNNANEIEPLTSHGSDRIILRMRSSGSESAIGIINHNAAENRAFIAFNGHFRKFGLNVPEIFDKTSDDFSYLMEDLGDTTLLKKISECRNSSSADEEKKLYFSAIEALPEFQVKAGRSVDFSYCYQFNEFGEENIRHDINYFSERFLSQYYKEKINKIELGKDYDCLIKKLLVAERKNFLYRDFQSRNIMIKEGKLFFIDFQSGRRGALLYDIASLLYDARANIPQYDREKYIEHYIDTVGYHVNIDKSLYRDQFWYFAIIRIIQALGAYGYLGLVKGKSRFLDSIPLALRNICYIFDNKIETGNFPYLRKIFSEITT